MKIKRQLYFVKSDDNYWTGGEWEVIQPLAGRWTLRGVGAAIVAAYKKFPSMPWRIVRVRRCT